MGQMMAGAAHELNNPLTAILGVADLLRERATDEATERQLAIVLKQARRAAGIVQDLLAFSRPAASGREKIRLGEIIQRVLEAQQPALRQGNIEVDFTEAPGLLPIEVDAKLLSQVFFNILANAQQAISNSKGQGKIRVAIQQRAGKLCASFTDDGPGIPPEIIGKIFDPFFSTKRPGGGSGLGLTISMAIAKEHGGTIEAESSPGGGATISVLLPFSAVPVATPPPAPPAPGPSALEGRTVLIVDDEESIREIVHEGLAARGMKVESVSSAEEAFAVLSDSAFEIVVCDFNLSGENGLQFFERLHSRKSEPRPRFVFMTGDMLDPALIAEVREKGAFVMQKPFHISGLARLLAGMLEGHPASALELPQR
jgi:CheY-like chemotaxis protein/two-component sensor histidine kinase